MSKIARVLSSLRPITRALWVLRSAKLHHWVRVFGSLRIENHGELEIGSGVCFWPGVGTGQLTIEKDASLRIGAGSMLNFAPVIHASNAIEIGRHCLIGHQVTIMDSSLHEEALERRLQKPEAKTVVIEDHVWIGARAIILPGVRIGRGSIIGAGSVVSKSIPPYMVAAGNPARVIRPVRTGSETAIDSPTVALPTESALIGNAGHSIAIQCAKSP